MCTQIAIILLIIYAVLIIIYLLRKSNNIISVRDIIKQHFELISTDAFTFIIFCLIPIIMSISCSIIRLVTNDILSTVNVVLPIYIGLQFSVAGIICSIQKGNSKYEKIKESAFNEILFESILSILALALSFVITFIQIVNMSKSVILAMSLILYILIFTTVLNTFIVLKRLKFLFDERNCT